MIFLNMIVGVFFCGGNKNNRLYFISKSLDEKIVEKIDNGNIKASDYMKVTSRILIDKYEWDQRDTYNSGRNN